MDIQVQKLKLLKSNFLSERYALEDKIIKYYPQRITALENRIEGLKQDVETAKQHPKPTDDRFVGMEVKGVFYSEKADAGKAIIEACKQMNSPDPIPLGKYRGFETELLFNTAERNYEVRQAEMFLSAMTHTAILSVLITVLRDLPRACRLRKTTLRTPKISWKPQRKKSKNRLSKRKN